MRGLSAHQLEGMSLREVGAVLKVAPNTALAYVDDAIASLKRCPSCAGESQDDARSRLGRVGATGAVHAVCRRRWAGRDIAGDGCRGGIIPQCPDDEFALIATARNRAYGVPAGRQRTRTGMRLIRTILGDAIYVDLLTGAMRRETGRRSLLVHMFLRWSQHDAGQALRLAQHSTSDNQAARKMVVDAGGVGGGGAGNGCEQGPWLATSDINDLEMRTRRTASPLQVRRFVHLSMDRACDVARHFVPVEHDGRTVVREAFFFVDSAMRSRKATPNHIF